MQYALIQADGQLSGFILSKVDHVTLQQIPVGYVMPLLRHNNPESNLSPRIQKTILKGMPEHADYPVLGEIKDTLGFSFFNADQKKLRKAFYSYKSHALIQSLIGYLNGSNVIAAPRVENPAYSIAQAVSFKNGEGKSSPEVRIQSCATASGLQKGEAIRGVEVSYNNHNVLQPVLLIAVADEQVPGFEESLMKSLHFLNAIEGWNAGSGYEDFRNKVKPQPR